LRSAKGTMPSSVQGCNSASVPVAMLVFLGCWLPLLTLNDVGLGTPLCSPPPVLMHMRVIRALVDDTAFFLEFTDCFPGMQLDCFECLASGCA
jgi:hypothetical protein